MEIRSEKKPDCVRPCKEHAVGKSWEETSMLPDWLPTPACQGELKGTAAPARRWVLVMG